AGGHGEVSDPIRHAPVGDAAGRCRHQRGRVGRMTALGHPDVQELLGAYALDALDADEADAVELHLRDCPRCRAEVADYRETAALAAAVRHAASDPKSVPVHLAAATGSGGAADIVFLDGRAYLVRQSLPALPADETYQLWGKKGDTVISLGVLGPNPSQTILP